MSSEHFEVLCDQGSPQDNWIAIKAYAESIGLEVGEVTDTDVQILCESCDDLMDTVNSTLETRGLPYRIGYGRDSGDIVRATSSWFEED
jgi:hypothetical protein